MTAEAHDLEHHQVDNTTHARDYAGFINLLKWAVVAVAIVAAAVIYIISN